MGRENPVIPTYGLHGNVFGTCGNLVNLWITPSRHIVANVCVNNPHPDNTQLLRAVTSFKKCCRLVMGIIAG
jgi:hypothetical protein